MSVECICHGTCPFLVFSPRYNVTIFGWHIAGVEIEPTGTLSTKHHSFCLLLVPSAMQEPSLIPEVLRQALVFNQLDLTLLSWTCLLRSSLWRALQSSPTAPTTAPKPASSHSINGQTSGQCQLSESLLCYVVIYMAREKQIHHTIKVYPSSI